MQLTLRQRRIFINRGPWLFLRQKAHVVNSDANPIFGLVELVPIQMPLVGGALMPALKQVPQLCGLQEGR